MDNYTGGYELRYQKRMKHLNLMSKIIVFLGIFVGIMSIVASFLLSYVLINK